MFLAQTALLCNADPIDFLGNHSLEDMWNQKVREKCPELCPHTEWCFDLIAPCASAICPGHFFAICKPNYCHGCNSYFVDGEGSRIEGCGTCADLE